MKQIHIGVCFNGFNILSNPRLFSLFQPRHLKSSHRDPGRVAHARYAAEKRAIVGRLDVMRKWRLSVRYVPLYFSTCIHTCTENPSLMKHEQTFRCEDEKYF